MERIWAPWRTRYLEAEKPEGCIFCDKPVENNDEKNYILYRGKTNYVILNAFPYNPGHLMVVPYRHLAGLDDMPEEVRNENAELVSRAIKVMKHALNPQGFNIGVNMGSVAGAGIAGHVHTHIVPRWLGDNNCMPVLSETRVMSMSLAELYDRMKGKF